MAKKPEDFLDEDIGAFENEMDAPEKIMAGEILHDRGLRPVRPETSSQKIPAFVSLTKYKELRLALKDMRNTSASMRRLLENLKKNRDDGTTLLDAAVESLEKMDSDIDKIKGVLRV